VVSSQSNVLCVEGMGLPSQTHRLLRKRRKRASLVSTNLWSMNSISADAIFDTMALDRQKEIHTLTRKLVFLRIVLHHFNHDFLSIQVHSNLLLKEFDESCQVVLVLATVSLQIALNDQVAGLADLSFMVRYCSVLLEHAENFNDDLHHSEIS
jgi:hypothetical protein